MGCAQEVTGSSPVIPIHTYGVGVEAVDIVCDIKSHRDVSDIPD